LKDTVKFLKNTRWALDELCYFFCKCPSSDAPTRTGVAVGTPVRIADLISEGWCFQSFVIPRCLMQGQQLWKCSLVSEMLLADASLQQGSWI
jgi:hypothetical protein